LTRRLAIFKAEFPADFPSRKWHELIMEAMAISTLGEYGKAIELDTHSLEHAGTKEQRSISFLNLSEIYRHAKQFPDSLAAALKAYDLNPTHKGIVVNLAIALGGCGRLDDADTIRRILHQDYNPDDPKDLVALYETYSEEWRSLQLKLDSLRLMEEAAKAADRTC
jgi:tetratricopeptide (TPR) repeat protein